MSLFDEFHALNAAQKRLIHFRLWGHAPEAWRRMLREAIDFATAEVSRAGPTWILPDSSLARRDRAVGSRPMLFPLWFDRKTSRCGSLGRSSRPNRSCDS